MGRKCLHDVLPADVPFGKSVEEEDLRQLRFELGLVLSGLSDSCDGGESFIEEDVAGCGGKLLLRWRCQEALILGGVAWRKGWALVRHGLVRVRRCVEGEVRFKEGHTCWIPVHDGVLTT